MTTSPNDFDNQLRAVLGDAFEIERELTGGGMSRVFVATEKELQRKVVVKVLPPELAAGVNRERFRREIQLAAQLQHPYVVPLHTAGARGDLLYFTMPYIEGESLRHALAEHVTFSTRDVVRVMRDVADALAYAHERGVIHRDIKPGNVLRAGSHALVTDFGVAKAISASQPSAPGVTTTGMVIGSPQYMAPEQLSGDPNADHRVDIYALGLLAYELLAGEIPFRGATPQETLAAQLTVVPDPIIKRRPDVPVALSNLISRCLAKSPGDRPQTAAEVSSELDGIEVSSGSIPHARARSQTKWLIAAVAMLGAVAVFGTFWKRSKPINPSVSLARTSVDSVAAPPPSTVLTRDDSLAIARAIEQKYAEQRASMRAKADSAERARQATAKKEQAQNTEQMIAAQVNRLADSLRAEIQRAVLDSVARARGPGIDLRALTRGVTMADSLGRAAGAGQPRPRDGEFPRTVVLPPRELPLKDLFAERAANMGPPRRVLVAPAQLNARSAFLAPAVDTVLVRLRRDIGASGRFIVIDADSARLALEKSRALTVLAEQLKTELFVSFAPQARSDSSLVWVLTLRDVGAHRDFSQRAITVAAPTLTPLAPLNSLATDAVRYLRELDAAPRRSSVGLVTRP